MSMPQLDLVRRLLVIAPHPDDESLGCGGLIARTIAAQGAVCTVFVTDGGASHPGSQAWPRERLATQRKQEALAALAALGAGAGPRLFLDLRDADMPAEGAPAWTDAVERLTTCIDAFQPDLALLPWRRDPHRDHRDSWRLATEAIRRSGGRPDVLEYAIWLDELGAAEDFPHGGEATLITFDIAAFVAHKRAAVAAHASQTTDLIDDDPGGFRLTSETIARLCQSIETFWLAHESD